MKLTVVLSLLCLILVFSSGNAQAMFKCFDSTKALTVPFDETMNTKENCQICKLSLEILKDGTVTNAIPTCDQSQATCNKFSYESTGDHFKFEACCSSALCNNVKLAKLAGASIKANYVFVAIPLAIFSSTFF